MKTITSTFLGLVALSLLAGGCTTNDTPAYDECSIDSTDECEHGTGCFTISVGGLAAGMCTSTCSTALDCPLDARGYNGECISFGGGPFTCFEGCQFSSECAPGWSCRSSAGGDTFPAICLPD